MPDRAPPLVGRVAEQQELDEALHAAENGQAGAVVLVGEPGVGKSRLLDDFTTRASERGSTVLRGTCLNLGGGALPYLPLIEMLRGLVRRRGASDIRRLVDPAWPALARLLPAIAVGADQPPAQDGSPAQLLQAVLRLVEGCAEQAPTVVAVEDVHWIDQSTADLLVYLVRAFVDERVLVVGTCRSDGSPTLRALLSNLTLSGRCHRRELAPLVTDDMVALVAELVDDTADPAFLRWIAERSGGNAFYARELLNAGPQRDGSIPATIRELVQVRLDIAGPAARQVAAAVATAGRPVAHPLVAAASGMPTAELLAALRACVTAGVLMVDAGERYTFRHALTRDAVYAELLPGERSGWHRAIAEALVATPTLGLPDHSAAAAEIAHHWDRADDLPRTFTASIAAGSSAASVYGYAEAERHYARALQLWSAVGTGSGVALPDLLVAAADAGRWSGAADRAVDRIDQGLAALGSDADTARIGQLQERRGRYLWELGRTDESLRAYELAMAAFRDEPASADKAWALAGYATALVQTGRLTDAVRACREALAVAGSSGATAAEGRARNTLGAALTMLGAPEDGIPELEEAVRIAVANGDLEDILRGHANLGFALESAGRLEESLTATLDGIHWSRELGLDTGGGAVLLANAASVLTMLGRWEEAGELLAYAGANRPPPGLERYQVLVQAELDVARGRFGAAEDRLAPLLDGISAEPQLAVLACAVRAEAALWQRAAGTALDLVEQGLAALPLNDDPAPILRLAALGLRAAADLRTARLRAQAGDARADAILARVAATPSRLLPAASATRALCMAEHGRLHEDDDPQRWDEVAARWDALAQPYPAAYARLRQAEALINARRRVTAGRPLGAARRAAQQLGAAPLVATVDAVARTARLNLRDHESPAAAEPQPVPFGLTRREVEVVALIADGLTNRQIARRLLIAEKTAGVHVSNILGKLGVANRGQAAAAARRAGAIH